MCSNSAVTRLEDVKIDDAVLSRNENTGKEEYKKVIKTFVNENKPVLQISLIRNDTINQTFRVTGVHPFYVKNQGWKVAEKLSIGDTVSCADTNWLIVKRSQDLDSTCTVYNFEVEDFHAYFVGDAKVWVHNSCKSPEFKEPKKGVKGKEGSKDVPSWAEGERPKVNENGNEFAKRLLDKKYGNGNYKKGPDSEYNKIRKYGDRAFQ